MGMHHTIGTNGIERLVHTGPMNIWLCKVCEGFCGKTYAPLKVIRYAFCRVCDETTDQEIGERKPVAVH